MNNIDKIVNEPNPIPRMSSSREDAQSDDPILPGFNDVDFIDNDDKKSSGCGGCRCMDTSCDGYSGFQTILACCLAVPLAFVACFSCC
ncbi:hypothetical protein RSOLAG1IB_06403 [Rhizoctonia solani AG-1 IB]|uniref:Uncharacterized protein n=1 Tax=Thanatephorus cucumeris (strain AG1-IB / isolate 7/3/14) TaxID=1108050 RepID=A0A0B7FBI4_THACB|nr:hypothetical protein RSOLAG1IB_06403 [Rhizoctonia solani AG-1 IB]